MIRATISDVKNSLSAYLRKVRAGETVIIMDRKTPVARLVPIAERAEHEARLEQLIAAGTVLPAATEKVPEAEPVAVDVDVLGVVLTERRSGR